MAQVVFLRGVNVGGNKTFRPALLVKELAALDAVNIGAAGTFIIRNAISASALRKEIASRLEFDAEIMICAGKDLTALSCSNIIKKLSNTVDAKLFLTVMSKSPAAKVRLPFDWPAGDEWQTRIVAIEGPLALCLFRSRPGRLFYPNEVVEKQFGAKGTTRNWNTIEKVCAVLAPPP